MATQPIRSSRFAFIDVETTGIDAATSAVVEVACQIVEGGRVVETFESLVDPGFPIPPFATAIHGIDDAMVYGRPRIGTLAPRLVNLCQGAVMVAHNAAFDRRFLPFLAPRPWLCSWRLATRVATDAPNHKNQTLRTFFGVDDPALGERRPHRALADVIVTRHVFFHLVDRYVAAGHEDDADAIRAFVAPRHERALSA